ncbi:MAG: transglycosylase family protein [Acidimicrobiaceae bacterium]|nr:transglycosylase family protein [Acidimicrobiaceae bacterium]
MESRLNPLVSVDLRSFSDRAAAWTEAHRQHRDDTRDRAMSLAAAARAAEESQALSNPTTTAAPTTTSVPTTTAAPATTAAPTTTTASAPTTASSTTAATPSDPTEEQWEALRQCESSGNYRAISISPAGRYRGAYQFSRSTWDWVAPKIGADYLVGVDPAEASPADQDRMALALWRINGWAPWPACSKRLGYL